MSNHSTENHTTTPATFRRTVGAEDCSVDEVMADRELQEGEPKPRRYAF
jgi:hypothetical protein